MRYAMCGWCRRFNPLDIELCRQCGHHAHVPRAQCACNRCRITPSGLRKALPAPDPMRHRRLSFVRWLVTSGRLSEQL